jgi:hypothetical protein
MLKRYLILLLLLFGAENLYAQGGEYWVTLGTKPPGGSGRWFPSTQKMCDTHLPSGSKPGYFPKKTYTFVNMELSGDEQNRRVYCYRD